MLPIIHFADTSHVVIYDTVRIEVIDTVQYAILNPSTIDNLQESIGFDWVAIGALVVGALSLLVAGYAIWSANKERTRGMQDAIYIERISIAKAFFKKISELRNQAYLYVEKENVDDVDAKWFDETWKLLMGLQSFITDNIEFVDSKYLGEFHKKYGLSHREIARLFGAFADDDDEKDKKFDIHLFINSVDNIRSVFSNMLGLKRINEKTRKLVEKEFKNPQDV